MYEARQNKEKVSRRIDTNGGGIRQKKIENKNGKNIIPFPVMQKKRAFQDKELKEHRSWAWRNFSETIKKRQIRKENIKGKILSQTDIPDKLLYIQELEEAYQRKCTDEDNVRLRILMYEWVMIKIYNETILLTAEELKTQKRSNPLSGKLYTHIFYGDFKNGKVTGYHSTCLGDKSTNRIADNPEREELGNGIYKAKVVNRNNPTKEKKDKSTFFPDSWTQEDITAAINMRNKDGYVYDKGQKWDGLKLCKNGDTIYPQSIR